MDCQYCKKVFNNKYTLNQHQKTAKYCLEIQGSVNNSFICTYCDKTLCTNDRLNYHYQSCKEKQKKDIIKDVEMENKILHKTIEEKTDYISKLEANIVKLEGNISRLEAKLEKFEDTVTSIVLSKTEKKPITTNNTTNNNIVINNNSLNLNDIPKMTAFLEEKMDKDVVAGGQKGLALLLTNTVLKDKYKCVDPSRQNFEFTNELGEVERDVKAKKLTNALIKSDICAKAGERGIQLWKKEDGSTDSLRHDAHSKKVLEMIMFSQDNSTFRSELSALTS
jgi:Zinc finger, C2H2 type